MDEVPVGTVEIAELLNVSRSAVDAWRSRSLGFPEPRWTVGGRPAWAWSDVEEWARGTQRPRSVCYVADDGAEHRLPVIGPASAEVVHVPRSMALTEARLKDWMQADWSLRIGDDEIMSVPLDAWVSHIGTGIGPGLHMPSPVDDIQGAMARQFGAVRRPGSK